jgi:hypothetical protein
VDPVPDPLLFFLVVPEIEPGPNVTTSADQKYSFKLLIFKYIRRKVNWAMR